MSHDRHVVEVQWPGQDALKEARDAVKRGCEVAIELPAGTHYVLYRHLHPGESGGHTERIHVTGGVELLEPIATVKGLEELAKLRPALERARYRVRLTSPEPTLVLAPPDEAR